MWSDPIHDMRWAQAIKEDVSGTQERYPAHAKYVVFDCVFVCMFCVVCICLCIHVAIMVYAHVVGHHVSLSCHTIQSHPQSHPPTHSHPLRVRALMTTVLEELPDVPLYFNLHDVCRTLHCSAPKAEIIKSAIINAGFRASPTHCNPLGIKTDAPWEVIWDIMRCWVAEHPSKRIELNSYAGKLMAKQPVLKADFSRAVGAVSEAKKTKQARFLPNPEPNWGPKARHKKVDGDVGKQEGKSVEGQKAEGS